MRPGFLPPICTALLLSSSLSALGSPHVRRGPTAPRLNRTRGARGSAHLAGMSPERATQIQTALIHAGYLSGAPSGSWDGASQAAMEKLQADNGWQSKIVPDSRALILLGLGSSNVPPAVSTGSKAGTPESPNPVAGDNSGEHRANR